MVMLDESRTPGIDWPEALVFTGDTVSFALLLLLLLLFNFFMSGEASRKVGRRRGAFYRIATKRSSDTATGLPSIFMAKIKSAWENYCSRSSLEVSSTFRLLAYSYDARITCAMSIGSFALPSTPMLRSVMLFYNRCSLINSTSFASKPKRIWIRPLTYAMVVSGLRISSLS